MLGEGNLPLFCTLIRSLAEPIDVKSFPSEIPAWVRLRLTV